MRVEVKSKNDYCYQIKLYMEAEIWETLLENGNYLSISLEEEIWSVKESETEFCFYLPGKREDVVELETTWEHHFDDETFKSLERVLMDVKETCLDVKRWSSEF